MTVSSDSFTVVFDVFQSLLSNKKLVDPQKNENYSNDLDKLSMITNNEFKNNALLRLQRIKKMREFSLQQLSSNVNSDKLILQSIKSSHSQADIVCTRHKNSIERILAQNVQGAERRMRELVFEIIGEYAKSDSRFVRRQEYLLYMKSLKIAWRVNHLRWQRFTVKLCEELHLLSLPLSPSLPQIHSHNHHSQSHLICTCNEKINQHRITGKVLHYLTDQSEITSVTTALALLNNNKYSNNYNKNDRKNESPDKHHTTDDDYFNEIMTIIKISHASSPTHTSNNSSNNENNNNNNNDSSNNSNYQKSQNIMSKNNENFYDISTIREFKIAINHLKSWNKKLNNLSLSYKDKETNDANKSNKKGNANSKGRNKNKKNKNNFDIFELLSVSSITWLHPASFYPVIWDKIYINKFGISSNESDVKFEGENENKIIKIIGRNHITNDTANINNGNNSINNQNRYSSSNDNSNLNYNRNNVKNIFSANESNHSCTKNNNNSSKTSYDKFLINYCTQHNAFIASDRIYYCMNERLLSNNTSNNKSNYNYNRNNDDNSISNDRNSEINDNKQINNGKNINGTDTDNESTINEYVESKAMLHLYGILQV